ncbi:MAG: DUF2182 domain-containing protein [Chloroflexota bacterium]
MNDRWMIIGGLTGITLLAWAYTIYMVQNMGINLGIGICSVLPYDWQPTDFVLVFAMWTVMMIAMMGPAVAPFLLLFAKINQQKLNQPTKANSFVPTSFFFIGYLAVWTVYSAVATFAQWGLHSFTLISPEMISTSPYLGGVLLIGAGLFQWSPLKYACLDHCRSPLGFLLTEWRDGKRGAIMMGLHHGYDCMICCWLLMALLFVAGVMNLLWMGIITALILIEKLVPAGDKLGRIAGIGFIVWGIWLMATGTTYV